MSKVNKDRWRWVNILLITGSALLFIWAGEEAVQGAKKAVMLCLNVIIPSLYAFTVISKLLVTSGCFGVIGKYFSWLSERVFHIRGDVFSVILLSQIAGYPIGASILSRMYDNGDISREEAENMLCFCIAPGPAYIMAVCRSVCPEYESLWLIPFGAVIMGNIVLMLLTSVIRPKPEPDQKQSAVKMSAKLFTNAVGSAAETMTMICGMIIFASSALGVASKAGLLRAMSNALSQAMHITATEAYPIIRSFFEISNLTYINGCGSLLIPIAAAMLSFGGICVHMQIMSVCIGFSPMKAIVYRVPAALLSFILCKMMMPKYFGITAVSVMSASNSPQLAYGDYSPILSIFLLIMTILILSQKSMVKNKKI